MVVDGKTSANSCEASIVMMASSNPSGLDLVSIVSPIEAREGSVNDVGVGVWGKKNVRYRSSSSSPPKFKQLDFPSLHDANLHKTKKSQKFGPPFDTANRWFKITASKEKFPFEEVWDETMKLKFTPIQLCWARHGKSQSAERAGERTNQLRKNFIRRGHFGESRWFRSPPKVRIVPGILGPHPSKVTCGSHTYEW